LVLGLVAVIAPVEFERLEKYNNIGKENTAWEGRNPLIVLRY